MEAIFTHSCFPKLHYLTSMNLQWKVIKRFQILIYEYQTQPLIPLVNEESYMYERLTIDISIRVRRVANLCFSSISSFSWNNPSPLWVRLQPSLSFSMSSSHHICDQKVGKMINKTQWNWRNKMEREERKGGRKRKKMVWSLVDQKRTASFSLSREQKDRGASKEQKIYSLTPPTAAVHSAHNSKKHDLWNIVFQSLPFFFLFLFSWSFLACFSLNSATNPSFLPVLCYFFNKST